MPSSYKLALASAFLAVSSAAPFKTSMSVKQVAVKSTAVKSGPAALAKTMQKFGLEVPDHITQAVVSRIEDVTGIGSAGSVTASPIEGDEQYLCQVSIGGQTVNLDFDTGSSDLWVLSPSQAQAGQPTYDPTKSTTATSLAGESWSISYGDDSYANGPTGSVYSDSVSVGGVTVSNQAVELASNASSTFQTGIASGLLGLGFNNINQVSPNKQATFFANAVPTLQSSVFTANLKHSEPGNYNFGYIDSTEYTGDIAYTPVDSSQGYWMFTADGYTVGDTTISTPRQGVADTGTTLLLATTDILDAYYNQISSATYSTEEGGMILNCADALPFALVINGYSAVVPSYLMVYETLSNGQCYGSLQSAGSLSFSIWGDVLFKSQLVVFDSSVPQLGFAAKP